MRFLEKSRWHSLTSLQRRVIVRVVTEVGGLHLTFGEFAERASALFEDIPGLESLKESQRRKFLIELWRDYHGKAKRKKQKDRKERSGHHK